MCAMIVENKTRNSLNWNNRINLEKTLSLSYFVAKGVIFTLTLASWNGQILWIDN